MHFSSNCRIWRSFSC